MNLESSREARHILISNYWPLADIDLVAVLALFIAAISLAFTIRAVRESARANILNNLPIIEVSYNYDEDHLSFENVGNGAALDIRMDKFYNWTADSALNIYGLSVLKFAQVDRLMPQQKVRVAESLTRGQDNFGILLFTMFSKSTKKLKFTITFRDLSNKLYFTVVEVHEGTSKVSLHPSSFWSLRSLLTLLYIRATGVILYLAYSTIVIIKWLKSWLERK